MHFKNGLSTSDKGSYKVKFEPNRPANYYFYKGKLQKSLLQFTSLTVIFSRDFWSKIFFCSKNPYFIKEIKKKIFKYFIRKKR